MKFGDLKFIRVSNAETFSLIPRRFFEQVKNNSFNIDNIYNLSNMFICSADTLFFALLDDKGIIKGILWCGVNVFDETVNISIFSIDKEYQHDDALNKTLEFIKSWSGDMKIIMTTTRSKAYEKYGWRKCDEVLMEI